jgi:hypothetical protein
LLTARRVTHVAVTNLDNSLADYLQLNDQAHRATT